MGRGSELTPIEMINILKAMSDKINDPLDILKMDLEGTIGGIRSNLLGGNKGHAKVLLENPQMRIDYENCYRQIFFELTGIDSRSADLPPEK